MSQICAHCHHASGAHGGQDHCDGCEVLGRRCAWAARCYDSSPNYSYMVDWNTPCTTCGHTARRHHDSTYCMSCADCDCKAFSARGCLESPTTAAKLGLRSAQAWTEELFNRIDAAQEQPPSTRSRLDRATYKLVDDLIREVQADAVRKVGGFDLERLQNQEIADLRARVDTLQKIPAIAIVDRLRQSD
jgi:hypothetical protein